MADNGRFSRLARLHPIENRETEKTKKRRKPVQLALFEEEEQPPRPRYRFIRTAAYIEAERLVYEEVTSDTATRVLLLAAEGKIDHMEALLLIRRYAA